MNTVHYAVKCNEMILDDDNRICTQNYLNDMKELSQKVFHELITKNENWAELIQQLNSDGLIKDYLGDVNHEYSDLTSLLKQHHSNPSEFSNSIIVTALMNYELNKIASNKSHLLDKLTNLINGLAMYCIDYYRKLIRYNNFDVHFLEDRYQEMVIENIRAIRAYRFSYIGQTDILTYAFNRIKTVLTRREMNNSLAVKVSNRQVSQLYKNKVDDTHSALPTKVAIAEWLDYQEQSADHLSGDYSVSLRDNITTLAQQRKVNQVLLSKLKSLTSVEKVVLFHESGLTRNMLSRNAITEHFGFSQARYSLAKKSLAKKLGISDKGLSSDWLALINS